VVFADTGEGIAQKDLNNLFIPFYTTKERGTGLGLAICQRIVEGHGGAVSARSRKGRGTTFIVQLPLENQRGPEA
jgi:signal transduction histidine kinase